MKSFATSFNQADILIMAEIYPAGETPIAGISGQVLYEEIKQLGHKNVYFEPDMKKIAPLVGKIAQPEDIILIMGAGDIYQTIPDIVKTLESRG
jgi:UDP-N-acetylmuramate--alanine ligase